MEDVENCTEDILTKIDNATDELRKIQQERKVEAQIKAKELEEAAEAAANAKPVEPVEFIIEDKLGELKEVLRMEKIESM